MTSTLITGADGHLGRATATKLIRTSEDRLILFCRAVDRRERARKLLRLGTLAENPRCQVVFGDLAAEDPFAAVRKNDIRYIVHAGAVTDFGIARDHAERVNVNGTRRAVEFAGRCPELQRFVFLSSLYSAGLRNGPIEETFLDEPAEFANHYEWSKWQAEDILRASELLPSCTLRIGTILCDDDSGTVSQQNVVHNTLRLLYYGLLSVVPGEAKTRVYLTTTRIAVERICRSLTEPSLAPVLNVATAGTQAIPLGSLLDIVYEAFMRDERFARHGILKPLFCDQASFETLADSIDVFGGAMAQSLESIRPFAPQLYSDKDVRVSGDIQCFDVAAALIASCEHLIATRWGLNQVEGRLCA